ncbi:SpoIIE family protein phosphatase [Geodermatophilus sp. DSM 44513]|uniref:SpoIIE family protein phosphatase n=1 Tax=Geodermatophilus sp. DSM 44513 TaxID=1528104 RepID=UPI0028F6DE01|nr:SpoIIE family protein phosphatase [Geodermatophilus sp. DSM 44513]WNV75603.1 SpoIIE family protein phosphatase [Geodermatophilus sp. DSM 44513]
MVSAASAVLTERTGGEPASAALPEVLSEVPVAVLLIDRSAGAVTYANSAAVELAGNVRLPVDIDTWGTAAGLTDLGGQPLVRTSGPLSLVAEGQPVTGEAVRLAQHGGDQDAAADDRLLWVTGFPLSRADGEEQLSLVVFLEVEGGPDRSEDQMQALRERAVVATDIAFTISDPRQPDDPLVWVNPSLTRITGYEYGEAVGRNCRFLQGPATDPHAVAEIRAALDEGRPVTTTLLNHRRDGTAFWNQLAISPVFDGEGQLVSFVGVQTDVTERVRVEREREAAFAAEQAARREAELAQAAAEQARADAERAQAVAEQAQADAERARSDAERMQGRLALMAEATSTLIATLDLSDVLDRLARLCVPLLADWVFISLVDDAGTVRETASRHRDGLEEELHLLATEYVPHLPPHSPTRRSMATSRPVLAQLTAGDLDALLTSDAARRAVDVLGTGSLVAVPMVARRRTRGAILLVRADPGRPFDQEEVDLAEDLARRAALAMDNVRLYQQEHVVADTLQRSLLPELPDIPGVESSAHYVSASTASDVGGDFYDLLHLPDGSIGVVIGDVVGHDVVAAAAMGHLRGLIRACAWEAADPDPGIVLARVDRLVQGLRVAAMATLVYARAVPPAGDGDPWRLHVASAGHPPVLLRAPDGGVRVLDEVAGLLVGVDGGAERPSTTLEVPPGTTLLAYTDGLIERPGTDLDEGIAELVDRLAATRAGAGPRELCDAAVAGSIDGRDDVALLAVRFS